MQAAPLPPLDSVQSIQIPSTLDSVRSKLLQLIESLTSLLSQLHYLSLSTPLPSALQPGLLSYPELISRYNLLLSHCNALGGLLSEVGGGSDRGGAAPPRRKEDRNRDLKRERWSASLVVPAEQVEESKDWLVGMLLRTKQVRPFPLPLFPSSLLPLPAHTHSPHTHNRHQPSNSTSPPSSPPSPLPLQQPSSNPNNRPSHSSRVIPSPN